MGRRQGVSEAQITQLGAYAESRAFDEQERACLVYADRMTDTPAEVPDAAHAAVARHLTAEQLVELTCVIAWQNYRARFAHALGLQSGGYSDGSVCAVAVPIGG